MFSKLTYTERRKNLAASLSGGLILLPGNEESPMNYVDNTYHFRQDSTFLYYFGVDQASLAGVIDADTGESILFGDELTVETIVWTGVLPSLTSLAEQVGIKKVKPTSELSSYLSEALAKGRTVHYLNPYRSDIVLKISAWMAINHQEVEVKKYSSKKIFNEDGTWQHEEIHLIPHNNDFDPIIIRNAEDEEFIVVGEFLGII